MLFNSVEFIFEFLPVVVVVFYLLARFSLQTALAFLTVSSLFFYAWWRPVNVLIISPSILVNYLLCKLIISRRESASTVVATAAFGAGIAFNVLYLCYFKYLGFFEQVARDVGGLDFVVDRVLLPLGLSFITFQKIALLVDVRAGRVKQVTLREYVTFVLFFPPLISGPIVHYRELMPQFRGLDGRMRWSDIALGITLFSTGLAKKLVIADPIAVLIAPYWHVAAAGGHPTLLQAWAAMLGYMMQLYFDFSGYTDMAIGAARLFGIKLPPNFDAPLKAASIIDYWSRWHMTLTRFLTAYVFTPIAMSRTRKQMARGQTIAKGRAMSPANFAGLVAVPTLQTMFISGMWHGAGYQFIVFGVLHGMALVVNHAWRTWRPVWWPREGVGHRASYVGFWFLLMVFVLFTQVFFRSPDVPSAIAMLHGMVGGNGLALPGAVYARLGPVFANLGLHVEPSFEGGRTFVDVWLMIVVAWTITLSMPTIYELTASLEPALGWKPRRGQRWVSRFRPSAGWAFVMAAVSVIGLISLGQVTEFLYWQF